MDETNFDWDDLRLFLAVARKGGLAAAATATGKSAPTLGRRMLRLERQLGADLFHRLPRGYELTRAGQDLLDKAIALEHQMQPILDVNPDAAPPIVKISAGTWVTHLLCRNVSAILGQDKLRVRFTASDTKADIGRREALIGVRNQRPDGPGLAGRRIGQVQFAIYAADERVRTWGVVMGNTPSARWMQANCLGAPVIEVGNPRNALDLALAGQARIVLPTFIGSTTLNLQRVSPIIESLTHEQWLVTHHEDRFVPEVRKVIDRLAVFLKSHATAP